LCVEHTRVGDHRGCPNMVGSEKYEGRVTPGKLSPELDEPREFAGTGTVLASVALAVNSEVVCLHLLG
jgi:hypothetical protein